jgi:hypothetical protein
MKAWLIHFLTTLGVVTLAGWAYDGWVVRPSRLIGMVDVGEVVRLKEAEFTQQITRAGADEHQRALDLAQRFAERLPIALDELPRDCRCLVLVRSAVAGAPPHAIDLTAHLKRKVDLP